MTTENPEFNFYSVEDRLFIAPSCGLTCTPTGVIEKVNEKVGRKLIAYTQEHTPGSKESGNDLDVRTMAICINPRTSEASEFVCGLRVVCDITPSESSAAE